MHDEGNRKNKETRESGGEERENTNSYMLLEKKISQLKKFQLESIIEHTPPNCRSVKILSKWK